MKETKLEKELDERYRNYMALLEAELFGRILKELQEEE